MVSDNDIHIDQNALREQIEVELKKEKRYMAFFLFLFSLALYIVFMLVAWSLFLSNGGTLPAANMPGVAKVANPLGDAMMFASFAGFFSLLVQFINLVMSTRAGERQLRERITGRVLSAALLAQGDDQAVKTKEKRKRAMRVSDDGELEEVPDDTDEPLHATQGKSNLT
jgi:ABC-type multidrug transport system fused ATPase/permease subunit